MARPAHMLCTAHKQLALLLCAATMVSAHQRIPAFDATTGGDCYIWLTTGTVITDGDGLFGPMLASSDYSNSEGFASFNTSFTLVAGSAPQQHHHGTQGSQSSQRHCKLRALVEVGGLESGCSCLPPYGLNMTMSPNGSGDCTVWVDYHAAEHQLYLYVDGSGKQRPTKDDKVAKLMQDLPGVPTKVEFSDIKKATKNFHDTMKLGKGGFGAEVEDQRYMTSSLRLASSTPMVLHRDIKASNIMLDSTFRARLGDFGIACATDIYAFGVLVLEVVTGKKNADVQPDDDHITRGGARVNMRGVRQLISVMVFK
ncbi:hypothetical protein HU200_053915 [Digitaria exilis]|uniref:Protein kinase domain-containing protein n=1 Tax=Digitaria exilis TaxID=1010633 RepID=A0A835AIB1_9POAL|nr:hypothetical protein HU200_053915 [Digitaria exilis]